MSAITHSPFPTAHLSSHAPRETKSFLSPPMTFSKLKPLRHLRGFTVFAAAVRQGTTLWTPATLLEVSPAAESLFHITIDVSDSPGPRLLVHQGWPVPPAPPPGHQYKTILPCNCVSTFYRRVEGDFRVRREIHHGVHRGAPLWAPER
ncbi:unnamed protein product [Fraxinus pennsylvanica]|uniref:Uncharacterized protein n=1 Tax=Fraxinus pennsylvanica TaxID=56036 RepID=A0AAD1YR55_9LAMI|nr:unnamed protein product [Fraxinus pennsylvanica]